MKKILAAVLALSATCALFSACMSNVDDANAPSGVPDYSPNGWFEIADGTASEGNYVYDSIVEQDFTNVKKEPSSYFSLDRNTASYALVRNQIESDLIVSADAVRIEEMINYFDYDFAAPTEKAVAVSTALSPCPWNEDNKLMAIGLKTTEYQAEFVNANYVFLIDVSGSMAGDDRLGLAKKGFKLLLNGLGENDVVSLVTYASGVNTVLDGAECTKDGKEKIEKAVSSLTAHGYTSGGDGLERAYKIAQKHFVTGGNNRVIIISDGDFNAGIKDTDELKEFIQTKAESGVYLSVVGVGMDNTRDDILETLATSGNGNYAYLDSESEAEKVFVDELKGNLFTVAKDAKAGVTFTSAVEKYRLVGYDTKSISKDDFDNEKADTGEIGSNLCVTALYELTLAENAEGKIADIEVKYKDVTGDNEVSDSVKCEVNADDPSNDDLSFISCVAEFGLILRNSKYKGTASLSAVLTRLDALSDYVANDIYKQGFVTLVGKASESGHYE